MKLPFPFFQNNKEAESNYYLALLLTDEKISAIILHESEGKLRIIGQHHSLFSASLELISFDDLINLIDKTISTAEEVLPPDIETHKTVFGVKETWVEAESKKIKKEYLAKLKKVCDALDITPIGFMVVTEAISHLLQEEEGAPLSAILAEIGHKKVTLTLLRGGKAVERSEGALIDSAPVTVDTLLKNFTTAVLPARIILFDGKNGEKLSQEFIGHTWSKSLPFLHVPQISALPLGFDGKAVTFGAAAQMGFELIGSDVMPHPLEKKTHHQPEDTQEADTSDDGEVEQETVKKTTLESSETSTITEDNFGFVMNQDIASLPTYENQNVEAEENARSEHADYHQNLQTVEEAEPFKIQHHQARESDEEMEMESDSPSRFAFLQNIKLPHIVLPSFFSGRRPFILPIVLLVVIIAFVGGFIYYYFNSMEAHIVLTVEPKMVNQDASITFSPDSQSDFSKNLIAGKPITTSVDGSLTIDTTGKKDVGNKAKGTVTVYNNQDSSISLDSGTAIKSSNGVVFLLDKSVSVASESGDIFSGTKPGTTTVSVTAREIGTDSNLPSGTTFSIGSNPNLAAKNDNAFSGGSKKTVQVVSKNDIATLKADLPKNLEDKAKQAISQKSDNTMTLLPFTSVVSLDKSKFDNDIDDEAKKVTLTASVTFEALAYQNDELNNFSKSLLKDKYSQDISDKSIKNTIENPTQGKNDDVSAKIAIQAGLLPDINSGDVINKIKDLSSSKAKDYLSGLPQVANTQINFSPNIPLLPGLFPKLPKNITVEIKPE